MAPARWYCSHRRRNLVLSDRKHTQRQEELAAAMDIVQAPVAPSAPAGQLFYTTEDSTERRRVNAGSSRFTTSTRYRRGGSSSSYLGAISMDQGTASGSSRRQTGEQFQSSRDSALCAADARAADAEKLLRHAVP